MRKQKQHYVQQAYLQNFNYIPNPNQICVFDLLTKKHYLSNIQNAACENHYNDVELDSMEQPTARSAAELPNDSPTKILSFETVQLSNLENKGINAINHLISILNPDALEIEEKNILANYFALQALRVPSFRESQKIAHSIAHDQFYERIPLDERFLFDHCHDANINKYQSITATQSKNGDGISEKLSNTILDMRWSLCITPCFNHIYISDNPMMLCNPLFANNATLNNKHTFFFFPLTPNIALFMQHRDQPYPMPTLSYIDDKFIYYAKRMMILGASRYLYAQDKENFLPDTIDIFNQRKGRYKEIQSYVSSYFRQHK